MTLAKLNDGFGAPAEGVPVEAGGPPKEKPVGALAAGGGAVGVEDAPKEKEGAGLEGVVELLPGNPKLPANTGALEAGGAAGVDVPSAGVDAPNEKEGFGSAVAAGVVLPNPNEDEGGGGLTGVAVGVVPNEIGAL